MPLIHLGVGHQTVRSAELAALGARGKDLPARLLAESGVVRGAVLLATCNRFEIYLDADEFHPAVDAARAELGRIERGAAALEITLAIGQPALMVQTPVNVRGFKPEIDGTDWLCKSVEHSLDDNGLTTRLELERRGANGEKPKRRKKRNPRD